MFFFILFPLSCNKLVYYSFAIFLSLLSKLHFNILQSTYLVKKMDKTAKKRKRVQLTIENKLKVCEMAKNNVPKAVIMSQFSIGKSTLNDILRSEGKFKKFKAEKEELGLSVAAKTTKKSRGRHL